MKDIFGYQHSSKFDGQVASSDFARVSVRKDDEQNAFVQDVNVSYQQKIEEVTQVGDSQIYWIQGRPQGQISVQELVGSKGFFDGWDAPCGRIDLAQISLKGSDNAEKSQCTVKGTGKIKFQGLVVESVTANLSSQRQTVAQGAQMRVSSMSKA